LSAIALAAAEALAKQGGRTTRTRDYGKAEKLKGGKADGEVAREWRE
jgi:hypothetical protein